jgi:hypothetical protein
MRAILRSFLRGAIAIVVTLLWVVLAFGDVVAPTDQLGTISATDVGDTVCKPSDASH